MSDVFTDADLRNWVLSINAEPPLSDEAIDALVDELDRRYDVIGPLTDGRTIVDDIPEDVLWSLVEKVMDQPPYS